jgi:nitrate reductase gamma subunit
MHLSRGVAQLPYLICYLAFAVFAVTMTARFAMWARLPMHVRWELYPVPHEPNGRASYGGSFMEEADWWKKPRETSSLGAFKAAMLEIFYLASVKAHNPRLWSRTFSFHLGLYLVSGAVGLALLTGALTSVAPGLVAGGAAHTARASVKVLGVPGLALGMIGALALLHRRLTLPSLRLHTVPGDFFNLIFFAVTFGSALLTFLLVDRSADRAMTFAANLVSFNLAPLPGTGLAWAMSMATVVLVSALLVYFPLTHMSHCVGKYFAFHAIRWNDDPNLSGGPQENEIGRVLAYRVSWPAGHIRGEGKKSWVELAMEDPAEGVQ